MTDTDRANLDATTLEYVEQLERKLAASRDGWAHSESANTALKAQLTAVTEERDLWKKSEGECLSDNKRLSRKNEELERELNDDAQQEAKLWRLLDASSKATEELELKLAATDEMMENNEESYRRDLDHLDVIIQGRQALRRS